jgi:hypothetical protein
MNWMRINLQNLVSTGLLLIAVPCFGTTRPRHGSTTHATLRNARYSHSTRSAHHESAPGMAPERATEIQSALIKSGYMSGEPTGSWDSQSVAAMQKLQGDNGWQTKITPDSRALIKLGLGPQQPN